MSWPVSAPPNRWPSSRTTCRAPFAELDTIRKTLETHFKDVAGLRVHHRGRRRVYAPNPQRQNALASPPFASPSRWKRRKLIDWQTAIRRVPADQLDQVLAPIFDRQALKDAKVIAKGLPAGPGAASGRIYLNADRAVEAASKGERVLLVRNETSPEDLRGMIAAEGILTAKGGVSSHAALVARQWAKSASVALLPCRSITPPKP